MYLGTIGGYVGETPSRVIHELCDYPQMVMAGIIASKFFPHQSKVVFWGFAVAPLICKSHKYVKKENKLFEMPEHITRILGKVITTGQAIVYCYRAPEWKKLFQGAVLTLAAVKDVNNTQQYLKTRQYLKSSRDPYFDWNYHRFDQSCL